jgi:hypothetical protein
MMENNSKPQTDENRILITIEEMSKRLSIGMTKCYEIVRSPEFTPLRIVGGRKLVDVKELASWLGKQTKGGF